MSSASSWSQLRKRKIVAVLCVLELMEDEDNKTERKERNWIKRRDEKGFDANIIKELSVEDSQGYKEMMRMSHEDLLFLLSQIEKDITPKQISGGNPVISAKSRLTLAIRFLATGESYRSLQFQFRISASAISYIIKEVCAAVVKNLTPVYLKVPTTTEEWIKITDEFQKKWNFPNCVGAIDGKHIVMQPPANSGSYYFNYKHMHSIVLLAIAGPDYECLYADIGTNGRISDGGVWNKSSLAHAIENRDLCLPEAKCLPYGVIRVPHVFVGDDAFALKEYMMKPFPQAGLTDERRVYNYRHSRARRISENLFGILANRWRIFRSPIALSPETIEDVTMTALTLHNYLRKSQSRVIYCPTGLADREDKYGTLSPGLWRAGHAPSTLLDIRVPSTGHNSSNNAKEIREIFKEYFCNEGAIPWQWSQF